MLVRACTCAPPTSRRQTGRTAHSGRPDADQCDAAHCSPRMLASRHCIGHGCKERLPAAVVGTRARGGETQHRTRPNTSGWNDCPLAGRPLAGLESSALRRGRWHAHAACARVRATLDPEILQLACTSVAAVHGCCSRCAAVLGVREPTCAALSRPATYLRALAAPYLRTTSTCD